MSIALITLMLAPLVEQISSSPFVAPPAPIAGNLGPGDAVEAHLYQLQRDVLAAHASGAIDDAAASDLAFRIERLQRQMFNMGNVVGPRQRERLRARIDAIRTRLDQAQG